MKKLLSVLFILTLVFTTNVNAQDKIGWINSNELLELLPETPGVKKRIESFAKKKQTQLKSLENEYNAKIKAYETDAPTMTKSDVQRRQEEILKLEARIKEFYTESQKLIVENEQKELKPLFAKVQTAIDAVASRDGFSYVFDLSANQGLLVYKSDKNNMTPAVKKQLGI